MDLLPASIVSLFFYACIDCVPFENPFNAVTLPILSFILIFLCVVSEQLLQTSVFVDTYLLSLWLHLSFWILFKLSGVIIFLMAARKKRATRGAYSPSQQETSGSRVELGNVLKKPPEERLIWNVYLSL